MPEASQTFNVKVRLEVGPGVPVQLSAFTDDGGREAILVAMMRAMTAEVVYAGPEHGFTGTHGGVAAYAVPLKMNEGSTGGINATHYSEWLAEVTVTRGPGSVSDETPVPDH